MKKKLLIISAVVLCALPAFPQSDSTAHTDLFDLSLEQLLNLDVVDKNFYLYGYINANFQKTFDAPSMGEDGETVKASDPAEWTPVKNFHLYGQGNLSKNISYLFNIAYDDKRLDVRNAWGNFMIREAFQIRIGKMYRKFGLYNERLDQIPTFIGIEAPEMLDSDHLFLTRTTNAMIHGTFMNPKHEISYALMTDNGEGGPVKKLLPLGWDLRMKSYLHGLIIGTSGYTSSISSTRARSNTALGEGTPDGGVLPWMEGDRFTVAGVFVEKQIGKFLVQSEYYTARHNAVRNAANTLRVVREAGINPTQRSRFLGANAEKAEDALTEADVVRDTKYTVQTWYLRVGYNMKTNIGQMIPYVFVDWMSHPEAIRNQTYGGDNEAGLADDGKFLKPSIGVVYRPVPAVAIKLDGSYHSQMFNGEKVMYPELRLDFSFAFSNNTLERALND